MDCLIECDQSNLGWEDLLQKQLQSIRRTGLYNALRRIIIAVKCATSAVCQSSSLFIGDKIHVLRIDDLAQHVVQQFISSHLGASYRVLHIKADGQAVWTDDHTLFDMRDYYEHQAVSNNQIVLCSGTWPETESSLACKALQEEYAKMHGYNYLWDSAEPEDERDKEHGPRHFRKSSTLIQAATKYPDAVWFIWVDADMLVHRKDVPLTEVVTLHKDDDILYHVTHEKPLGADIVNSGIKCVHRNALQYEQEIWDLRHTPPYTTVFYDQKALAHHVLKKLVGRYTVYDWRRLNCFYYAAQRMDKELLKQAIFVHMCGESETRRLEILQEMKALK